MLLKEILPWLDRFRERFGYVMVQMELTMASYGSKEILRR